MHQIINIKYILTLILHLFLILLITYAPKSHASQKSLINWSTLALGNSTKEKIEKDNSIYCKSKVHTENKQQHLEYFIAGLHKKSCRIALSKLSQYERFSEFLDFVHQSKYDNTSGYISLLLKHMLMPFDMILNFKIPRIKKPGLYTFQFDRGFLKNLTGEISISSHNNRCLFTTKARWSGPKSRIPDRLFSFFSEALGKNAMQTLFRISLTR